MTRSKGRLLNFPDFCQIHHVWLKFGWARATNDDSFHAFCIDAWNSYTIAEVELDSIRQELANHRQLTLPLGSN